MNTIILKILCWINGIKNPFVWAAKSEELEEQENDTGNMACDNYGMCAGYSCANYPKCQGWVNRRQIMTIKELLNHFYPSLSVEVYEWASCKFIAENTVGGIMLSQDKTLAEATIINWDCKENYLRIWIQGGLDK